MREREESWMTPRFFNQVTGRMELPSVEMGQTSGGASLKGKIKTSVTECYVKFEMLTRHHVVR